MTIRSPHRTAMTLAAIVFAVSGLAACGSGSSAGTGIASAGGASTSTAGATAGNDDADGLKFAACMRQNGINMPDPDPSSAGGGGGLRALSGTIDQAKLNAALQKCQQYQPAGGASALADPANQKALQALASCMRSHGVNVPDPDPIKGFAGMVGQLQSLQSDPDWTSALTACQSLVPTQDAK